MDLFIAVKVKKEDDDDALPPPAKGGKIQKSTSNSYSLTTCILCKQLNYWIR